MILLKHKEILLSELISNLSQSEKIDEVNTSQSEWMDKIIYEIENEEENQKEIIEIDNIIEKFNNDRDKKFNSNYQIFVVINIICFLLFIGALVFGSDIDILIFLGGVAWYGLSWICFEKYVIKIEKITDFIDKALYVKNGFISTVAYSYLKYKTDNMILNKELLKELFNEFGNNRLYMSYEDIKNVQNKVVNISKKIKEKQEKDKKRQELNSYIEKTKLKVFQ